MRSLVRAYAVRMESMHADRESYQHLDFQHRYVNMCVNGGFSAYARSTKSHALAHISFNIKVWSLRKFFAFYI